MKIYLRHVLAHFLGLLILTLGVAIVVFVVVDFVGNSKTWLARPPKEVYRYYLDYMPHILYLVLPVALLLASVFSVGNMARHLELVALRAAGIPILRILSPILFIGLVASGVMFWFENSILPDANHRRYEINEPKNENDQGGDPMEKFNYLYTSSDGLIFYFDFYSGHRNTGQGVTVLSQPKKGPLAMRIDAKNLVWDKDRKWLLKDGTKRVFKNGNLEASPFKEIPLPQFQDQPKDLLDDRSYPEEMNMPELDRRIAILKRTGESSRVLETERYFRFSSSLVNLFMALIGTAMSVHTIKSGLARNFGIALGITFLYYVALRLGLVMGENGSLTPIVGAWLGNMIFGPLGLLLMWKASRA
jgi:lipopolysaccharide export system permease protein